MEGEVQGEVKGEVKGRWGEVEGEVAQEGEHASLPGRDCHTCGNLRAVVYSVYSSGKTSQFMLSRICNTSLPDLMQGRR